MHRRTVCCVALLPNRRSMKRILSILLVTLILAFTSMPITSAQTVRRHRRHSRTFWQKHRDKLTVAGTAAAGAGIGGLTGGKKGAAIGTAGWAGRGTWCTNKIPQPGRHRRRHLFRMHLIVRM